MINVGIVGEFQSGKSLLINCILGQPVATVGNRNATTHTVVRYAYTEGQEHLSYDESGIRKRDDIDKLNNYETNGAIEVINVFLKNPILRDITLIDMPGLGFDTLDDKRAASIMRDLDYSILLASNAKAIAPGNDSYNTILMLRQFNIPYYFVLNCIEDSNKRWDPSYSYNRLIANDNRAMMQVYPPLSFPFGDNENPIINLMWYWFSICSEEDVLIQNNLSKFYGERLFERNISKNDIGKASNFHYIQTILGKENQVYLTLRKEFREEMLRTKDEICPVGTIQAFAFDAVPSGWLFCDGRELEIADYPALYDAIGTFFGGNGKATFRLPDLRNQFIRGWTGEGSKRHLGNIQEDAIQDHGHVLFKSSGYTQNAGKHDHYIGYDEMTFDFGTISGASRKCKSLEGHSEPHVLSYGDERGIHNHELPELNVNEVKTLHGHSAVRVATETRPKNIALMYCIKAGSSAKKDKSQSDADIHQKSFIKKYYNVQTFKEVSHFGEGRVRCQDQDGWLYITPGFRGKNHYEKACDYSEKRAAVMIDGKWGFIDYDENLVIPCIYSKVGPFSEGVAYYEKPLEPGKKYTIERGFINYNGKQVLSLTENYSGYGLMFDNMYNYGLFKIFSRVHAEWINHDGTIVNKYQGRGRDGSGWDFSVNFGDIIDGVALGELSIRHVVHYAPQNAEEEQMSSDFFGAFMEYDVTHLRFDVKQNVIVKYNEDRKSETSIPSIIKELSKQYSVVYPFIATKWEGITYERARVKKNGLWGFVDEMGNEVIPCVFEDIQNFSEGYAAVNEHGGWFFIDVFGEPLIV